MSTCSFANFMMNDSKLEQDSLSHEFCLYDNPALTGCLFAIAGAESVFSAVRFDALPATEPIWQVSAFALAILTGSLIVLPMLRCKLETLLGWVWLLIALTFCLYQIRPAIFGPDRELYKVVRLLLWLTALSVTVIILTKGRWRRPKTTS